jgi:hypothetical protein
MSLPNSKMKKTKWQGSFVLLTLIFLFTEAYAQQPFVTDDADVTPKGKLHFEFRNAFDLLQRSAYPNLRQDTANFELDYGLLPGVEIGIGSPIITIFHSRSTTPRAVGGIGDTNFSVKYNFYKERDGSRLPAMAVQLNVELPTGDVNRQLGSGLTDVWVNTVAQKSLTKKTVWRVNAGLQFAGNQATGVLGIATRGIVFTGGTSLIRKFGSRLQLGGEVAGAVTRNFELSRGQLQTLVGGNYELRKGLTIDFGVDGGGMRPVRVWAG